MLRKQHYQDRYWTTPVYLKAAYKAGEAVGKATAALQLAARHAKAFAQTALSFGRMLLGAGLDELPVEMNYSLWV